MKTILAILVACSLTACVPTDEISDLPGDPTPQLGVAIYNCQMVPAPQIEIADAAFSDFDLQLDIFKDDRSLCFSQADGPRCLKQTEFGATKFFYAKHQEALRINADDSAEYWKLYTDNTPPAYTGTCKKVTTR